MTYTVFSTIDRVGIEIEIEAQVNVTHWGCPASWYDPGDGPEWEIERLVTLEARLPLAYELDLSEAEQDKLDEVINNKIGEWVQDYDDDYD